MRTGGFPLENIFLSFFYLIFTNAGVSRLKNARNSSGDRIEVEGHGRVDTCHRGGTMFKRNLF